MAEVKLQNLKKELRKLADKKRAKASLWFFKTGPGQYGEGDKFLGIKAPIQRKIAQKYREIELVDIQKLIKSEFHEERGICLIILLLQFKKADEIRKKNIYDFYLKNTKYINNWDLVDISAPRIIGGYLENKNKDILYKLAKSKNLWERRIAILATFYFISRKDSKDALKIAKILLNDKEDLIHKAVGWMLREIGKNCGQEIEEKFLRKHYKTMPRTMLRYAIEKFPENIRKQYLKGGIINTVEKHSILY